jgi:tetratricopeptide (TPR) repeat protein
MSSARSSNDNHASIELVLREMVAQIVAHEDFEQFIAWTRANAQRLFGYMYFVDEGGPRALGAMVARSVWNRMPLPGNGFRPRPVPEPGRNDPCPCGSGDKFKVCCATLPRLDSFETDDLWIALVDHLTPDQIRAAIASRRMPALALAAAAERELAADAPSKAVSMLQPLFDDLARCDERCEPALDVLCDAYQVLGHDRKRIVFLERVARECKGALAGAAGQRLAAMLMDRGEREKAWEAFRAAQKADPDSLSLALNEVTLLLGERRSEEAGARARFYLARFRKLGCEDEALLEALAAVAKDPHRALTDISLASAGVDVGRIRAWLDACLARALPKYEAEALPEIDPDNDTQMLSLLGQQMSSMGVPPEQIDAAAKTLAKDLKRERREREKAKRQRPLLEPTQDESGVVSANARVLIVPAQLSSLERQWRQAYPCAKPFGVGSGMEEADAAWDPGALERWLRFLEAHPEAGDSLDILDDVTTALLAFDARLPQGAGFGLAAALAERGCAIVVAAVGDADMELPWSCLENRCGLRLVVHVVRDCLDRAENDRAAALMRFLLRVNPNDNHGFRAVLVNHMLRTSDDDAALDLIARYPGDRMVDTRYGAALAHFRRGELELAKQDLALGLQSNAHVPSFLIKARVSQPRMHPEVLSMGGRDEAWEYREHARDIWEVTPGALEWLKAQTRAAR